MSLTDEELKKIAKKFIKKVDPGLADQEPTVHDRQRSIPRVVERKLGLEHPKTVLSNVKVFTFRKTVIAEDGAKIPIISIITIDENGNIIKAVKSR
jgi:hypothetical protein